jgi:hypothetical protein
VSRIFLLSPAHCGGKRARQLVSPAARFSLAERVRSRRGANLGDVFTFVSGLYFRGKLTYALRFAAPPLGSGPVVGGGVQIITPTAGLQSPDARVTIAAIRMFARGDVDPRNAAYRRPLETSSRRLLRDLDVDCEVVLLGSIASPKYVDVLLDVFGDRLRFPIEFVGRGDMSRGGLLLRKAAEGVELEYIPVAGAERHGPRPPKLPPLLQTCRPVL